MQVHVGVIAARSGHGVAGAIDGAVPKDLDTQTFTRNGAHQEIAFPDVSVVIGDLKANTVVASDVG